MPRKLRKIPWLETRDEIYYVFWYDKTAGRVKRVSLGTTDSVEAQKRYASFLAHEHEIVNQSNDLTVSHALDQYEREHVDANVIAHVRARVALKHLKEFFGSTPLKDIDIPASRAYADARRAGRVGRPAVDSTVRRELVALVAAANHARKWKRITLAEIPSIELPKEARQEAPWLTKDELRRAIYTASGHLKAFIQIAYYTAGRRASIESLRKSQIDLRQSRINLRAPDETAAQRNSKKRRPVVPLFAEIRPVVERLMIESRTEYLFGEPKDVWHPYRAHMNAIGLAHKGHPHVLRHSRATHLLQDGVSIYDVARLLGDTITTVDRVYGHHSADHLAETLTGASVGA